MKKILIFPAGTEIAFEILNALKYSKFVTVYGGTSVSDHSEFIFENLITGFPLVTEHGFIDYLNDAICREKIDCIYPAHDSVGMFLSEHSSEINAQIIISDYNTVKICRSKFATYNFFKNEKFIPEVYETYDSIKKYPVFVKPEVGQGSQGAKVICSKHELEEALQKDPSLIVCEYLPGMEFTIDCFTDRYGILRVIKLRNRERIRSGISVRSRLLEADNEIKEIAEVINRKLEFRGAWFFQVKKNADGKYYLMEISPRIPGTVGLSRNLGINFALLTLFDFWGYDVDILDNEYDIVLDKAFYSAYRIDCSYEHIYIDFDDTLIVDGKVNVDLIKFLYQARNQGKKLHLLSKHIGDIYEALKKYGISEVIFEDIKIIAINEEKKDCIEEKSAIFIDDSFRERKEVKSKCGIPVFDLDMVEALINWKM